MGGDRTAQNRQAARRDDDAAELRSERRHAGSGSQALARDMPARFKSPAHALDGNVRRFMEARFGVDFGSVRLHTARDAAATAEALGAAAVTTGDDVVFGAGLYDPRSARGLRLLGHELAHVAQNRQGGRSDDRDDVEAAETSAVLASHALFRPGGRIPVGGPAPVLGQVPRSVAESLDPTALSDGELEEEIRELQQFLASHDSASDPQTEPLVSALRGLESEVRRRDRTPRRSGRARDPRSPFRVSGGADFERLVTALRTLEAIRQVGSGWYEMVSDGRTVSLTQPDVDHLQRETARAVRNAVRSARVQAESAQDGYTHQSEVDRQHWIVSRIVKTLGGIRDPGPVLLLETARASQFLDAAETALADRAFVLAGTNLARGEECAVRAQLMFDAYWRDIISTGESTVTALEYTRNTSFFLVALMATVATAGAAAGLTSVAGLEIGAVGSANVIATGAPILANFAQGGVSAAYGDDVDWGAIVVDSVVVIVLQRFSPNLSQSIAARMVGQNPAAQRLGRHVVAGIVSNLITGRGSAAITASIRAAYRKLRGRPVTWRQFVQAVGREVFDPSGAALDILTGAIGAYGTARGAQLAAAEQPISRTPADEAVHASGATVTEAPPAPAQASPAGMHAEASRPLPQTAAVQEHASRPSTSETAAPPEDAISLPPSTETPTEALASQPEPGTRVEPAAESTAQSEPSSDTLPESMPAAEPPTEAGPGRAVGIEQNAPATTSSSRSKTAPENPLDHPDAAADIDRIIRGLDEPSESGGFTGGQAGVRVPVRRPAAHSPTQAHEPTTVLEIGAGRRRSDLGIPNQRRLVAITRTDVRGRGPTRPGTRRLRRFDAEGPIPPEFVGRFDVIVINNPYGYRPNFAQLRLALRPGGRIIIQGRSQHRGPSRRDRPGRSPDFQDVWEQPVPPGFRRIDDLPPSTPPGPIMGRDFSRTRGGPVRPNARMILERTED